jgi:carbon storage regulator
MIGDGISIEVLRIGRDGVRLGVKAPPEVAVHRKEIYDQIRDANQKAAAAPADLGALAQRLKKHA